MNQKNSLGLNGCFLDLEDPIQLFNEWMEIAKKSEPNDPNAVALATSNKNNTPSLRMVLLIFVLITNNAGFSNLKKNKKKVKKDLTCITFNVYI